MTLRGTDKTINKSEVSLLVGEVVMTDEEGEIDEYDDDKLGDTGIVNTLVFTFGLTEDVAMTERGAVCTDCVCILLTDARYDVGEATTVVLLNEVRSRG